MNSTTADPSIQPGQIFTGPQVRKPMRVLTVGSGGRGMRKSWRDGKAAARAEAAAHRHHFQGMGAHSSSGQPCGRMGDV